MISVLSCFFFLRYNFGSVCVFFGFAPENLGRTFKLSANCFEFNNIFFYSGYKQKIIRLKKNRIEKRKEKVKIESFIVIGVIDGAPAVCCVLNCNFVCILTKWFVKTIDFFCHFAPISHFHKVTIRIETKSYKIVKR